MFVFPMGPKRTNGSSRWGSHSSIWNVLIYQRNPSSWVDSHRLWFFHFLFRSVSFWYCLSSRGHWAGSPWGEETPLSREQSVEGFTTFFFFFSSNFLWQQSNHPSWGMVEGCSLCCFFRGGLYGWHGDRVMMLRFSRGAGGMGSSADHGPFLLFVLEFYFFVPWKNIKGCSRDDLFFGPWKIYIFPDHYFKYSLFFWNLYWKSRVSNNTACCNCMLNWRKTRFSNTQSSLGHVLGPASKRFIQ